MGSTEVTRPEQGIKETEQISKTNGHLCVICREVPSSDVCPKCTRNFLEPHLWSVKACPVCGDKGNRLHKHCRSHFADWMAGKFAAKPAPKGMPETSSQRNARLKTKISKDNEKKDELGLEFKTSVVTKPAEQSIWASVIAPAKGQLDGWFLLRSVSLVGAPSGAGKTSILYHLLVDQRKGEPFLGHKTFGLPFYVIGADRGKDAHLRTMERMGLPADSVPFAKMPANVFGVEAVQMIVRKLEKLQERGESPAMLLVEGVDFMVEENNDIIVVSQFMTSLTRVAEHFNIAIIATMGSPKLKAGQGYEMKRENLFGSQAWGRTAETVINIQFPKDKDTKGRRMMWVLPRNAPAEEFTLGFEHGKLVQVDAEIEEYSDLPPDVQWMESMAIQAKDDPTKEWWTAQDMCRATTMGESTARRHIADALTKRYIRTKRGPKNNETLGRPATEYQWNDSPDNLILVMRERKKMPPSDQVLIPDQVVL